MSYDLKLLDFDAIQRILVNMSSTVYGKEAAKELCPAPNLEVAKQMQSSISCIRKVIDSGVEVPLEELQSIRAALKQASVKGAALNVQALAHIKHTLLLGLRIQGFVRKFPQVYPFDVNLLEASPSLLVLLDKSLEGVSSLSESASEELAKLSAEYRQVKAQAQAKIEALQSDKTTREFLAEGSSVYWQGDRAVLVVKNRYIEKIKGVRRGNKYGSLDHLIEPLELVGVNNQIEKIGGQIGYEQQRLLREITDEVRINIPALDQLIDGLTWVDLALAGARLSEMMNAHAPSLVPQSKVCLRQAYHPILLVQFINGQITRPVPLSLELNNEQLFLLITGPNTGGKTVALKTLGLLVCMALCGLHIPAEQDCEIGWYDAVMVDMGDRQNLYHQLSTFAGHVEMMKRILAHANQNSLLLLDELGTGTDPEEGAALAMAILDEFVSRSSQGVLNTHLSPLKDYGERNPKVTNASMKFDYDTLKPTYELQIGVSGLSLGLTVAQQNGLDKSIIENARQYLSAIKKS